jgi:TonB-dependent receptor
MNRSNFAMALLCTALVLPVCIFSQTHSIFGRVLDKETRAPLVGATVRVTGTNTGAITNDNGVFLLSDVSLEQGYLSAFYLGYAQDSLYFDFGNKEVLEKNLNLRPDGTLLQDVEIKSSLLGQAAALNDQRTATSIKNVISAEQMVKFPDLNAAESIARVPGITLQRDQGEGRYVQLRGTPPELSNFSVNGEQIPSPEGGIRYVALDVVPIDQLSSVEIFKALTPDLDGDAIGGAVNLNTKTAKDTIPEVHGALTAGYNNLSKQPIYSAQFAYGQRFEQGRWGFYANGSILDDNRDSHNMEFDFNESRFGGDTTFRIHYDDVQLRHYDINRQRIGLSGTWDFRPNPNHRFSLNMMYNRFTDHEIRRRTRYNIGSGFLTSETSSREARVESDVRDRTKIQTLFSGNFGGKHRWEKWGVEYLFSRSQANEDIPDRFDMNFINDLINIELDLSEPNWPRISFPRPKDSISVENPADFKFDEMLLQDTRTTDRNHTGRLNIERFYEMGRGHGSIKVGGKVRLKDKERQNEGLVYSKYFQIFAVNSPFDSIRQIYNTIGPKLSLETVYGGFEENNLLNRDYVLGETPDPEKSRDFARYYFQNFKLQESDTKQQSLGEDFTAKESIYAGYIMATHYWGPFMALGGVRYEHTNVDYTGINLRFEPFSDAFQGFDSLRSEKQYKFLLPQFHFKYSPNQTTNYRAALTWTYSRPNFDDILPYRQTELDSREITQGNPDLNFAQAINFDLLAEKYLARAGILSGGVFYKRIDDFIYYFEQRIYVTDISRPGWYFVTTAQNGKQADVAGAEISWNQQFYQLPGGWKYCGIYFNYTYTWSRAVIAQRQGQEEEIRLPGQSPNTVNLALIYDSPKWYAKLSANFNDAFLDELGIKKTWDVYYERNLYVDFNANYNLTPHVQLYVNALNLTNQPLRYYIGERDRIKQQEFYSWWGRFGVRINL